jgi:hypothetical protein
VLGTIKAKARQTLGCRCPSQSRSLTTRYHGLHPPSCFSVSLSSPRRCCNSCLPPNKQAKRRAALLADYNSFAQSLVRLHHHLHPSSVAQHFEVCFRRCILNTAGPLLFQTTSWCAVPQQSWRRLLPACRGSLALSTQLWSPVYDSIGFALTRIG